MYGHHKAGARANDTKAKLHLGNPSDKPGHIDMGTGFGQNPMHNPNGPSVFGTNPLSGRSLHRQENSHHSRGASMASSIDYTDRASDGGGAQPEKMQDQVFAMLDGQEDPVRGERGWSVFPDGDGGGDGNDGAQAVNPMVSGGKRGSNPLGLGHATLNVLRRSVVGEAPAELKQRDSGSGSGGDDGDGGSTAAPETRMARRSVADVEPSAHV